MCEVWCTTGKGQSQCNPNILWHTPKHHAAVTNFNVVHVISSWTKLDQSSIDGGHDWVTVNSTFNKWLIPPSNLYIYFSRVYVFVCMFITVFLHHFRTKCSLLPQITNMFHLQNFTAAEKSGKSQTTAIFMFRKYTIPMIVGNHVTNI